MDMRSFPVVRIFQDESGVSHFEDGEVETRASGPIGFLSDQIPDATIVLRVTEADYDYDWHPTPARQFIAMMTGAIEVTVGDGETRTIRAGETLFLEDLDPPGHKTRNVGDTPRYSIFIQTDAPIPYRRRSSK